MRIIYCIICHKNTNALRTTIEILSADNDIYTYRQKKLILMILKNAKIKEKNL